jgi:metal-sulfur cluster biosynthetic enzyme
MTRTAHDAPLYIPAQDWDAVDALPQAWAPPPGWRYAKRLQLANDTTDERRGEPVEVDVDFRDDHLTDLAREVRVARVADGGPVTLVPCQVETIGREDHILRSRLFLLADVAAESSTIYLVLYGNPDAPPPAFDTDLSTSGEGFALEVENEHYRAVLSTLSGNWKSHFPKGWKAHLDPGGGHGVEGTMHWGPDWSEERVGRYRITNWDGPPLFDYEVTRGPVCVRVRRWGHPILSLGPQVGRPHKVRASVTYTFWAGQPYVVMESELLVLEDVRFRDCRNDEFVIGEQLPERAWRAADGEIGIGARGWDGEDPQWMSYFHPETGEGFGSVHLEFENTNPSWPQPDGGGFSRTGVWVRAPVHHTDMRAGERVYERNAYMAYRFEGEEAEDKGFEELVAHQRRLLHPLQQKEAPPAPRSVRLDSVMDALRGTNEFELYVKGSPWTQRQLSFVDIGIVRDVVVDGSDVRVDLVMPYAGRETWMPWFTEQIEEQLRARLQDVEQIEVRLVRDPKWTPQQMSDRARRTIGEGD